MSEAAQAVSAGAAAPVEFWFDFSSPGLPRPVPAMATFHPAYLLRTPAAKREAWRDLVQVKKRLAHS